MQEWVFRLGMPPNSEPSEPLETGRAQNRTLAILVRFYFLYSKRDKSLGIAKSYNILLIMKLYYVILQEVYA